MRETLQKGVKYVNKKYEVNKKLTVVCVSGGKKC